MNTLNERVSQLWDELETHYRPTLTEADFKTLRALDDAAIDGELTEAHFERTKFKLLDRPRAYAVEQATTRVDTALAEYRRSRAGALFGDYELIIDSCMGGDPDIKERVRAADNDGRRGLATLKHHLGRLGVKLPAHLRPVMRSCEADQEYYEERQGDRKNIEDHRGKFRVTKMIAGTRHKASFDTLGEAQSYRDTLTSTLAVAA